MSTTDSHSSAVAGLGLISWRKSSYSGNGSQCVEFADVRSRHAAVALRDSKNVSGPALLVSPAAFTSFLTDLT